MSKAPQKKTSEETTQQEGVVYLRSEKFRQTRYVENVDLMHVSLNDVSGKIANWSRTGLAIDVDETATPFTIGALLNICVEIENQKIYEGNVKVISAKQIQKNIRYGVELCSGLFPVEGISSSVSIASFNHHLANIISEIHEGDLETFRLILTLEVSLKRLKKLCDSEELRIRELPFDKKIEVESIFIPNITKNLGKLFSDFNVAVDKRLKVESLEDSSVYHKVFEELIYPYFVGADFVRRAYEKPRGYAGDYEMMNQIYRKGYEGDNLFGRVLHSYAANEASSQSVLFRKNYFFSFYVKSLENSINKKIHVLSVACGPAVELQHVIKKMDQNDLDRFNITLFDLDREALEHAQSKVLETCRVSKKHITVEYINESVRSMLTNSQKNSTKYDLIYSGGLFDYLDNSTSAALVRKFSTMLNPKGTMVIGNFTKDNPTKAFCHLVTKWSLIHKTDQEIMNWANGIDDCSVELQFDDQKINAFIVLRKNEVNK